MAEDHTVSKVWNSILKIIKLKLKEKEFNSWILNVKPLEFKDNILLLQVDNNFLKEKIEKNYKVIIEEILNDIMLLDGVQTVIITCNNEIKDSYYTGNDNNSQLVLADEVKGHTNTVNHVIKHEEAKSNLNQKHIFESFIVGKSNEFAHAAAEGVANTPGKVYNPLFIYGGVGLGKTHLMHAIGNKILAAAPSKKVYYCTSEKFTNDMINSIKTDKMPNFREKYRKLDVILIDDIQFIAGKESTQEEFFYTFNALHQSSKQIVISSDRPPQEINNLEERLTSRFAWGLIADIKPPDYETRVAILTKKAEEDKVHIPEEAIKYIAESVSSNIRELEGAFNRIVAKASLLKKEIDFELVEEVFTGFISSRSRLVTKEKIMETVSKFYKIPMQEIKSNKRKQDIAKARQISMYLLRNILELPFSAIGDIFNGKDHTTVMHSVSKIEKEILEEKTLKDEVSTIKESIFI